MTTSYRELCANLLQAAQAAQASIEDTADHSDARQARDHLQRAIDLLSYADYDEEEKPTKNAVLSRAAAITQDVIDKEDYFGGVLESLVLATSAAEQAGFDGDKPELEWFFGDVPRGGTSHD